MRKHPHSSARPGFTLVEVMVVISIIILLAAILIVAIGQAGVKAREQATIALIKKVSNQVQERLEAFDRLKSQQQYKDLAKSRALLAISTSSGPYTDQQLQVLGFKRLMREQFPQSHEELRVYNNPDYLLMTASPPYTGSGPSTTDPTESSECLYFFLTQGSALGIPTMNPGDYKSTEVADTDNDGLLEFVDAWGRPLRFYRWPTRLICPGSSSDNYQTPSTNPIRTQGASVLISGLPALATPDPLAKDQDDPTLLLSTVSSSDYGETQYHTPQTYHNFLIISSGPDGQKIASPDDAFGLFSPNNTANFGYLAQPITGRFDALTDNITNRNR